MILTLKVNINNFQLINSNKSNNNTTTQLKKFNISKPIDPELEFSKAPTTVHIHTK